MSIPKILRMTPEWSISDKVKNFLLDGAFDELSPVIRLNGARYIRYDEIVIKDQAIVFRYKGEFMAQLETSFVCDDSLSITSLEGRLKIEVKDS